MQSFNICIRGISFDDDGGFMEKPDFLAKDPIFGSVLSSL